jgi:hypothetical protein
MDVEVEIVLSAINVICLIGGFYNYRKGWSDESHDLFQHQRMTDLEIEMLNKKVEKLYGIGHSR